MAIINMINYFRKNKTQKGYAILFTVIIVSAISVITAGLTNAAYKQLILSSLAKDSQSAFYQADTASDCALYADRVIASLPQPNLILPTIGAGGTSTWTCGGSNLTLAQVGTGYTIYPTVGTGTTPCFRIDVTKDGATNPGLTNTKISAKGYNICNKMNLRTVEREIEINYQE
jgi:hypothetical protein